MPSGNRQHRNRHLLNSITPNNTEQIFKYSGKMHDKDDTITN